MRAEAKYPEEIAEVGIGAIGRQREADVVLDGTPGQQARFLKHDPETPRSRGAKPAAEIRIEPGGDLEDRGLATTGGADQGAERPGVEPQFQVPNNLHRHAICRQKALRLDPKLKRVGVSSDLRVVQAVAPRGFQSTA